MKNFDKNKKSNSKYINTLFNICRNKKNAIAKIRGVARALYQMRLKVSLWVVFETFTRVR